MEYIPVRHYFHRHTKTMFWMMRDIIPFSTHPLFNLLLGWATPPKVSFIKLTQTEGIAREFEEKQVAQDMLVPGTKLSECLDIYERYYSLYPLWLCPYRQYDNSDPEQRIPHRGFLRSPDSLQAGKTYEMWYDLGAYGTPQAVPGQEVLRRAGHCASGGALRVVCGRVPEWVLRAFCVCVSVCLSVCLASLRDHGLRSLTPRRTHHTPRTPPTTVLYADSYLTRAEFREMFDHSHYDAMKAKYDPDGAFPEIYDKTCKGAAKMWEGKTDVTSR